MEYVKLDELCDSKIERLSHERVGKIDYIDISSVDNKEKKITAFQTLSIVDAPSRAQQLLNMNDILVSTVRPNLNAVAVCDIESENIVVASTGYCVLRCKKNVDYRYVFHFCKSKKFVSGLEKLATGASYPAVSNKEVRGSLIPLFDFNIQKNISNVLDKAQELIDKRKEQIAACDELIKSLFYHMFGDPIKNDKNFSKIQLKLIGDWKAGGTPARNNLNYYKGEFPWLTSGELNHLYVKDSKEYITELAINDSAAKLISKGSLLLGMYDTAALKSTINEVECTCNQAIAFAKLQNNKASTLFVYFCIQFGKEFYKSKQRGVRQKNLNLSMIKDIEIILPSLNLQNDFAKKAEKIEQQKQLLAQSLTELENNFNSLMQRAFKGKLF